MKTEMSEEKCNPVQYNNLFGFIYYLNYKIDFWTLNL